MVQFFNGLGIIFSSPLKCKMDSLSSYISSVVCLGTAMFGHFSVHQHPEFLSSPRSRLFTHRSLLPLLSLPSYAPALLQVLPLFCLFLLGSPFSARIRYFSLFISPEVSYLPFFFFIFYLWVALEVSATPSPWLPLLLPPPLCLPSIALPQHTIPSHHKLGHFLRLLRKLASYRACPACFSFFLSI